MSRGFPWSQEELALLRDNPQLMPRELAIKLGRTRQAISTMRNRINNNRLTEPVRAAQQELRERPPGIYTEVVGQLLLEYPDVMEHWMHAHGYHYYEVTATDELGWALLTCVKEA